MCCKYIHMCVCSCTWVWCACVCLMTELQIQFILLVTLIIIIGAVLLLEMFFLTQSCFLHCHYKLHREPPHPQRLPDTTKRPAMCLCLSPIYWSHTAPPSPHPSGLLWFDMTGSALNLLTQAWIKPVLPFPQCRAFLWVFSDLELDIMLCG